MRTFDNHLTGVSELYPHPESYRSDIPLSNLSTSESRNYRQMQERVFASQRRDVHLAAVARVQAENPAA